MTNNIQQYIIDGGGDKEIFKSFVKLENPTREELFDLFCVAVHNGNIDATCYYFKRSFEGNFKWENTSFDFTNVFLQGSINGSVGKTMIQRFINKKLYCGYFHSKCFYETLCDHKDYDLLDYLIENSNTFPLFDIKKLIHDKQTNLVEKIINHVNSCIHESELFEHVYETGNMYFIDMLIKLDFHVSPSLFESICENKDVELINCYKKYGYKIYNLTSSNINSITQCIKKTQFFEILEIMCVGNILNFNNESVINFMDILPPHEFAKIMDKRQVNYSPKFIWKFPTNLVNNLVIYDNKYTRYFDKILCKKTSKNSVFIKNNKSVVDKYINSTIFSPSKFKGMCGKRQTTVLHLIMVFKYLSVGLNKIIPKPIIWIIINNMFLINWI